MSGLDYVEWLDQVWERRRGERAPGDRVLSIGVLLWPAFPLMSLTGIVESLRHAGDFGDQSRPIEARWEIMGPPGRPMRSSCGIDVSPTSDYLYPGDFDWICVIGGLLPQLHGAPAKHRRYIRAAHRIGVMIAAICTGSFVLAEEGLLPRATACIHPYHRRDFERAFPGRRLTTSIDFILAEGVATVPGGVSILSFMSHLIARHYGPDRAAKVVHQLSLPERRGIGDFERSGIHPHREISEPRIQKAIVMIEAAANTRIGVTDLARQLGMSERHFSRVFASSVGMSPREYMIRMRLRSAVWLLRHTAKPVTTVAHEAGFSSSAHLANACLERFGKTPSTIRRNGL